MHSWAQASLPATHSVVSAQHLQRGTCGGSNRGPDLKAHMSTSKQGPDSHLVLKTQPESFLGLNGDVLGGGTA